ncbi:MAG: LysR substrate-binding domain-containing protein [Bdellovibrionota bacterium]
MTKDTNSTQIDLNRLSLFREVVASGSFSRAAARLHMPKSRVSRHIASLEQALGVQLIYRTTRQFKLTQAGTELFQKAGPLLGELRATLDNVSCQNKEIGGLIKITVPEDIGNELMGKICHDFMTLYPRVEFGLFASNQNVDLVKDAIDLAVRIGPVRDSSMIRKKIGNVGTILVASPDFVTRHGPIHKIEQLEGVPHLAFSVPGERKHSLRLSNGKDTKTVRVEASFSCNNFFALRNMALLGAGFAHMPAFLVRDSLASGALVHLVKDWMVASVPIQILMPQQKEVPPRIRVFIDFLADALMRAI